MLALDVNLLTNKLQNQTLEDGPSTAPDIQLMNPDVGYKLSESAQARLGAGGQQLFTVSLGTEAQDKAQAGAFSIPSVPGSTEIKEVMCSHKKLLQTYTLCQNSELASHTSLTERPKKRHCRSVTMPQETEISIPPAKSTWQPQGSQLWKPIALATKNSTRTELDGAWDVRTVRWQRPDPRNYEFPSLAPSVQSHRETGHITPDDLLTPPESPVPRPDSVYSDGAISPFTGDSYSDYVFKAQQLQEFRNRSLSIEDKISYNICYSGSTSNMLGLNGSVPSSPHHRHRIPRCRSQPSFYDRKSGRRRRRDSRPTLNFNKMTETAYGGCRWPEVPSTPSIKRHGSRFHAELENAMSLMPIASSPQDSNIPVQHQVLARRNSPIYEFETMVCDSVTMGTVAEEVTGSYGPVKLLGDDELDENDTEVFQLTEELDLEEIETH